MAEMQERIDNYLSFGGKYVWIIDPRIRRAFVYAAKSVWEVKMAFSTRVIRTLPFPLRRSSSLVLRQRAEDDTFLARYRGEEV